MECVRLSNKYSLVLYLYCTFYIRCQTRRTQKAERLHTHNTFTHIFTHRVHTVHTRKSSRRRKWGWAESTQWVRPGDRAGRAPPASPPRRRRAARFEHWVNSGGDVVSWPHDATATSRVNTERTGERAREDARGWTQPVECTLTRCHLPLELLPARPSLSLTNRQSQTLHIQYIRVYMY